MNQTILVQMTIFDWRKIKSRTKAPTFHVVLKRKICNELSFSLNLPFLISWPRQLHLIQLWSWQVTNSKLHKLLVSFFSTLFDMVLGNNKLVLTLIPLFISFYFIESRIDIIRLTLSSYFVIFQTNSIQLRHHNRHTHPTWYSWLATHSAMWSWSIANRRPVAISAGIFIKLFFSKRLSHDMCNSVGIFLSPFEIA